MLPRQSRHELAERADAPGDETPGVLGDILTAVRSGRGGGLFPPVADGGYLRGDQDAHLLASLLASDRFTPLLEMFTSLDSWCRSVSRGFAGVLREDLLRPDNAAVFGSATRDVFVACASRESTPVRQLAYKQGRLCTEFLSLFLHRVRRDLRSPNWPDAERFRGPVIGLRTIGDHTSNGRQWVLGLDLAGGARVAYKPRPTSGKHLFLAPGGIFDTLNELPVESGNIRLPVSRVWSGIGDDRWAYSWEEWPGSALLGRDGRPRLSGPSPGEHDAAQFWHRAGSFAAAAFAYGVVGLNGDNVLVGATSDSPEPLYYPDDLEFYFANMTRLSDTGLVLGPGIAESLEPGFGNGRARPVSDDSAHYLRRTARNTLALSERMRPTVQRHIGPAVAGHRGQVGYGTQLPAILRGMFDAWTLMCANRRRIAEIVEHGGEHRYVRVVRRPATSYSDVINTFLRSLAIRHPGAFDDAELIQLRRLDVPYFFRPEAGGDVYEMRPPPLVERIPVRLDSEDWPTMSAAVCNGENLTLPGIGVALRDAVAFVFDDLVERGLTDREIVDPGHGVHLCIQSPGDGRVTFEWPQQMSRVTYEWATGALRFRISASDEPLPTATPCAAANVRLRLQRIDLADAMLRRRWAVSDFTDAGRRRQFRLLAQLGINWLEEVIEEFGWPGHSMVGAAAASAARRLIQHAEDQLDLQKKCLRLMRKSAMAGDLRWREVAYLTDTILLADGCPQRFGTRFKRSGDGLSLCPLEDPELVDVRRRSVGLEPLGAAVGQTIDQPARPDA